MATTVRVWCAVGRRSSGRCTSLPGKASQRRTRVAAVTEDVQLATEIPPRFGIELMDCDVRDGSYDQKSWVSAFDVTAEAPEGYWVKEIEGEIPAELHGTYFRNGPGDFNFLNEPVVFPFDANGIIGSVAIKDGKAFFRSRFVKTIHSMMEEKAGRRLFKGPFGTTPKNGVNPLNRFVNRNAASGKTFLANDKLYAPYEGSRLTEIDAFSLETVYPTLPDVPFSEVAHLGRETFADVEDMLDRMMGRESEFLNVRTASGFGDNKYDGQRDVVICHSYKPIPKLGSTGLSTEIKFYEFGEDLKLKGEQSYVLDAFSMPHAIGVSENYYILNKFPTGIDLQKVLDPRISLVNCTTWDPSGAHEFHLIPRPSPHDMNGAKWKPRIYKMKELTFVYHFVNAFEVGDKVIIDAIHYPKSPNFNYGDDSERNFREGTSQVGEPGSRWRRTICSLDGSVETHEISGRSVELPSINPNFLGRKYRYAYMLVGLHPSPGFDPQTIGKVDLNTGELKAWSKGPYYFAGEPLFVPRSGAEDEDDGWVMCFCHNGQTKKTEFVILDAKRVEDGPVATLYLDHGMCHGFHGHWTDKYFGP